MLNRTIIDESHGHIVQNRGSGTESFFARRLVILILVFALIRLFLAFYHELGNDEAYYWFYSQELEWNYFDHPPMVAVWIRIFTLNLWLDQVEGFLRLGSVAGSAVSAFFIFKATSVAHSSRAGWMAALLYHCSFYAGITSGLYILPDAPQMVCWTFSLWMIARIIRDEKNWMNWILFGIGAGLCIMSKVHGVFLWLGLGLYILFLKRAWLRDPRLYVAVIITALLISPIFIWNLQYNFATYKFHSSRVVVQEALINWRSFLKEIMTQVGFNNPVNFFIILSALLAWKNKKIYLQGAPQVFLLAGIPLAMILLVISLFRDSTLPHWSGPAYITLIPLAGIWLSSVSDRFIPISIRWAMGIFLGVFLVWTLAVRYYPGTWGSKNKADYGRGDITLDMYGWRKASDEFISFYHSDIAYGRMPAGTPLVASHWWGAHVEYYFAQPLGVELIGIGAARNLHHYLWRNGEKIKRNDPDFAYCIIPSDDNYPVPSGYYKVTELAREIEIRRNGHPAHYFRIYRLKGLKKPVPQINGEQRIW